MNLLGKISLILSLICFLLSVGFKLALTGSIPFIAWGFGFGTFFLIFTLIINYRFFLRVLKSESLHFVGKSLLLVSLVVGILFVSNFILYKKNVTVDLTKNKIHSLSDLTQSTLKDLSEPLNFQYFHVDNAKVRGYEAMVREFLSPYMRLNKNIKFQSYSIFKRPELAKKFKTGNEESTLYVEYKDRIQRVDDLNEMSVTNAVLKVSKKPKNIYFLESHEERKIKDSSTFGLMGVKEQLERLHYQIKSLDKFTEVPKDAAMLVIVGSRAFYTDQEISKILNYVKSGGALMVAMDPGEDHNLNKLVKNFGIQLSGHFIFADQAQAGQSDLLVLTHTGDLTHEVALAMPKGENPVFFISSSLKLDKESDVNIQPHPVLEHIPTSVGRTDISPESKVEAKGRQVAAAVVEGTKDQYFRVAVVADSDFMTNQFFARPANFNFILAMMSFLSKDEDLLKMSSPLPESTYLIMTQTQMNLYILFLVLPFCLLPFILGLFFKLRRYF